LEGVIWQVSADGFAVRSHLEFADREHDQGLWRAHCRLG
jgi:hypothetical protein